MNNRIVVIIQARMGSTRLPGKVMKRLHDRTVLAHVINRCQHIPQVAEVIVATSDLSADDAIAEEATNIGVQAVRGSESDVLSRYVLAAKKLQPTAIVRVTSDCPLLDPHVSGRVVAHFLQSGADYCSNTEVRRYPRGLDTEIFSYEALLRADAESYLESHREHVTQFIYQHPDRFNIEHIRHDVDVSHYRWTLDTPEDWQLIQAIYDELYQPGKVFAWTDVLDLLKQRPELHQLNAHIEQKKT